MKYVQALSCVAGLFQLATALPSKGPAGAERRQSACESPRLRKSWDASTDEEKQAYLDAAVCLTQRPSRLGLNGSTLHDDFSMVHYNFAAEIHGVAAFLPWHRFFIHTYEEALRTECGFNGTVPYWDWVADSASPSQASVWDPVLGFGGNGSSPDGSQWSFCVPDGPFKDMRLRWWSDMDRPHCLQRQWVRGDPWGNEQEMMGFAFDRRSIAGTFLNTEFQPFAAWLENGPHSAVHFGIANGNGDLGPLTSPNGELLNISIQSESELHTDCITNTIDPIFYLHHTMVDRLWWQFQQDGPSRVFEYTGDVWPNAALDDVMLMGGLAPDRTVREFMDASNDELCYYYEPYDYSAKSLGLPKIL
ncbi:Tyrosinase ustQ [Paramyrothecium foliicola]|nr:Tyrosinase ustQ [Paramyrothecium foliicola]